MWRHTWGVGLYMTLWDCSAIAAIRIVTTEPLTPRTANLDTEKHATQIQIQIGTQYKKKENISQVTLNMKHSHNLSYLACTANLIDPYYDSTSKMKMQINKIEHNTKILTPKCLKRQI